MENLETSLNEIITKLLSEGKAEFSQDGLTIKAVYDNGNFSIQANFESPEQDNTKELLNRFEEYIKSLSDEFFLETVESFSEGKLREIQDKLDSHNNNLVKEGIDEFMYKLKEIASDKIDSITEDIEDAENELTELIELRNSYEHVLKKEF